MQEISHLLKIFHCDQMHNIYLNILLKVPSGQFHRGIIGISTVIPGFTGNLFSNVQDFLLAFSSDGKYLVMKNISHQLGTLFN